MIPLRYISLKKILNLTKIYIGYFLSNILKSPIVLAYPFSLTTEPTNLCNLSCPECPTGNKTSVVPKGKMHFGLYKSLIDDLEPYVIYQMLYFQGEPFLNPEIYKMIRYSESKKIYTTLSTNGHYIDKDNFHKIINSGLKEIIISLDGTTQEIYEKYRIGGNLNKVLEGIKYLVEFKKKHKLKYPIIRIQYLVFKYNEHQLDEIKKLCKNLYVDKLEIKSAQIYDSNKTHLIPANRKYARYVNQNGKLILKHKLKNKCFRIWSTIVVTWQGKVIPCCFDKNNNHVIGNIIKENTLQLWKSNEFLDFRKLLLKSREEISICRNCTEGTS